MGELWLEVTRRDQAFQQQFTIDSGTHLLGTTLSCDLGLSRRGAEEVAARVTQSKPGEVLFQQLNSAGDSLRDPVTLQANGAMVELGPFLIRLRSSSSRSSVEIPKIPAKEPFPQTVDVDANELSHHAAQSIAAPTFQVPIDELDRLREQMIVNGQGDAPIHPPRPPAGTGGTPGNAPAESRGSTTQSFGNKALEELRKDVYERLVKEVSRLRPAGPDPDEKAVFRTQAQSIIETIIGDLYSKGKIPRGVDLERLRDDILDEALDLGPLQPLLKDERIEEIMVNGPFSIWVKYSKEHKRGALEETGRRFTNEARLYTVIQRILDPLNRRVNVMHPMEDCRLPDGSRVNVIIPPLAPSGPTITIRKFPAHPLRAKDLIAKGTCSAGVMRFLKLAIEQKQNLIVAGGTGAGKTTLLNVLSGFIPEGERIITIEDSLELQLQQRHVVSLETRPASIEKDGAPEVDIRRLVKNSLRMRPDRIIVGECRGAEAIDMLQAMNTGHEGSMTTGHANSSRDMLARLETMVLLGNVDLPHAAIRDQVFRAVRFVVCIKAFPDGQRRISEVMELAGLVDGEYVLEPVFRFEYRQDERGVIAGEFRSMGRVPAFMRQMQERGLRVPIEEMMGKT